MQSQETDTARVRLNMSYRLPDDVVSVDPLPSVTTMIVQGPRSAIRRAQHDRPTMIVDLRDVGVGMHDARLDTFGIEGLPNGLELVAFSPDTVPVRLDQSTHRNVEVEPRWMGQPAADRDVRTVTLTPKVVEVTGPRVVVDRIDRLQTMPIDVSGWAESRIVPVELDLPRSVTTARPYSGEAEFVIESQTTTRQLTEVPVVVPDPAWRPAEGSETIQVKLIGPTDVLRALRADQVIARVDLPPAPKASRYTVTYDGARPPRFEILVPRVDVRVSSAPHTVEVVRR